MFKNSNKNKISMGANTEPTDHYGAKLYILQYNG